MFPRGITRDGKSSVLPGIKGKLDGVGSNTVRWTSRYGNAALVSFEGGAADGLNEKGLAAHVLVLGVSQHEPKDERPELADALWVQSVLENFATVKEVVDAHRSGSFRVTGAWSADLGLAQPLGLHLAVEDAGGDSAIFEYIGGKLVIHHGPEFGIMKNDPSLDEMLARMKKYKELGGNEQPPGAAAPEFRFPGSASITDICPNRRTTSRRLLARCRCCALRRCRSAIRRVCRPVGRAWPAFRPIG